MEEDHPEPKAGEQSQKGAGRKPSRNPKQGNSQLFNEVLSACNALSVNERTRLVKSLAGQLSLVVIGSGELLQNAGNQPKKKSKEPNVSEKDKPRHNPLKGTKYELDKEEAYKALVKAKNDAGGAKLPQDHPAVVNYALALASYKQAHSALKPVDAPPENTPAKPQPKSKARTTTDRSPERSGSTSKTLIGNLTKAVKSAGEAVTGRISSTQKQKDSELL